MKATIFHLVAFGGWWAPVIACGQENDLKIRGYMEMAYDQNASIQRQPVPNCSEGVKAIASAQDNAKLGTKEGIDRALDIATKHIDSSPLSWESDILKLGLAFNYSANGDFKNGAEAAKEALTDVNFKRLQTGSDVPLTWMREKFGKDQFSQSSQDYTHRIAASYYMDYSDPRNYDLGFFWDI